MAPYPGRPFTATVAVASQLISCASRRLTDRSGATNALPTRVTEEVTQLACGRRVKFEGVACFHQRGAEQRAFAKSAAAEGEVDVLHQSMQRALEGLLSLGGERVHAAAA